MTETIKAVSQFQFSATLAAELENAGEYEKAASYWKLAKIHAAKEENVVWCRHRAEFCEVAQHKWQRQAA